MTIRTKNLSTAVRMALSLGVIAAGASGAAFAQDTTTPPPPPPSDQKAQTLDTITVTGSHIRRVDVETASPVITIDRAAIQATGKQTLGDLVQQLPAMTGGNVNPQTNNGGGTGGSSINLRGLGPNRTLILVDGHRVLNGDPNAIPASMIERIDVLTDGASAVYGSDAIGGVVNFITRKNYQGAQFTTTYGQSDHNDGTQKGYTFTFGQSGEKGSIFGGIEYNKQDEILAAKRKFSKNAVSLFSSTSNPNSIYTSVGGSSSAPYGRIQVPVGLTTLHPNLAGCGDGKGFAALNPGTNSSSLDNYHCYNGANDAYNYAATNLIMTPQERTNAFVLGTYNLSDNVQAYMNAYHNKTTSNFQLAPSVYGTPYGAEISKNSYYNPFGVDYNASGGSRLQSRLSSIGPRVTSFGTTNDQVSTGLKGNFSLAQQDWTWDVGFDYGHQSQVQRVGGLVDTNALNQGSGPSFLNAAGQVTCGTPTAPIAGCLPFNPFDINSPESVAALTAAERIGLINSYSQQKVYRADFSGGLFDLPAGTVQLAFGGSYRKEYEHDVVDPGLQLDTVTQTCQLGSQCSSSLQGGYNVKEVYAEAFVPVLKDLPLVNSLNFTVGDRYSRTSSAGSNNSLKFAVEYRPIADLLLRGTVAEVFRAPNIGELYGAPGNDAPRISRDPCNGYTGGGNPACANVPTDGSFVNQDLGQQINAITSGAKYAGFPLKPEEGKTFDFGAVYSPSWLPGFSGSVDFWHVYLNNIITTVGAQSVIDLCAAGQTVYCQFFTRNASGANQGQIATMLEPTGNLGSTETGGIDFSLNYKLPDFGAGNFTVGLNGTYLKYFNQQTAPGTDDNVTYTNAGHLLNFGSAQASACSGAAGVCLYPRWRGQGFVNWQMGNFDASWRVRYIGRFRMGSPSPTQDSFPVVNNGDGGPVTGYYRDYGATTYNDLSLGYNIAPINTRFDVGVNNLFDKQPPFLYANNSLNANTDPSDFDLIGRYFWARVTVSF